MVDEDGNDAAGPPSPEHRDHGSNIARKLIAMAQIWRREICRALTETGMSDSLALPLMHLSRRGDRVTQRCLAAWVGVDNSSIVRVLDALEQAGEIRREADSRDRRAKLICLTDQGQVTSERIEAILQQIRGRFLAGISPEDLDVMDRVLGLMLAQHERPTLSALSAAKVTEATGAEQGYPTLAPTAIDTAPGHLGS